MTVLVAAPPVPKQQYNLLDTITPKPMPGHGAVEGIEYLPSVCGNAEAVVGDGNTPLVCTNVSKTFQDGITFITGVPILIYDAITCRLVGGSDLEQIVSESLDLGASRAVEQELAVLISAAATTITPATVTGIIVGIALLEQQIASTYGGQGVIYMSRSAALIALSTQALVVVDGHLETRLGTLVVAGAGFGSTGPSAAAAGNQWMLATGQLNLWVTDTTHVPMVMDHPETNQVRVLAERLYVPTWECSASAIEVKLEA